MTLLKPAQPSADRLHCNCLAFSAVCSILDSTCRLPGDLTRRLIGFLSLSFFLGFDRPGWWFAALASLNGVLGGRLALALLDLAGQLPGSPPASNCP
jgi:hypothetical protein